MRNSVHLGYVPVQLIQYCLQQHLENSLRVYLALKYGSVHGVVKLNKQNMDAYCEELDITKRTLKNQIARLQELKWIGIDQNQNAFVRGFRSLQNYVGQKYRSKVALLGEYLRKDKFKAYLMGAVIGYFVKLQRSNAYLTGRRKARSEQFKYTPFPLSYSYIKAITNKCDNEIKRRIDKAEKLSFIKKAPNLKPLNISRDEYLLLLGQPIEAAAYPCWIDGKAYLRYSNKFLDLMDYKRFR